MRKIIPAIALTIVLLASGCTPYSVTAVPSTIRPACGEITTVTGVVAPADQIRNIVIEIQEGGQWKPWVWFYDTTSTRKEIRKSVAADGTYKVTYAAPAAYFRTIRLRARGTKYLADTGGTVSKSWYVTAPTGC